MIVANVVPGYLPESDRLEKAFDVPEPMFDEFTDGPESWTVMGQVVGVSNNKEVFQAIVTVQVMLVEDFDEIIESRADTPRHEKTAWVGIVDFKGQKRSKVKVPSRYLKVSLPDDLRTGEYKIRPANTGFARGFSPEEFQPLVPGEGQLVPDKIMEALADATEPDR